MRCRHRSIETCVVTTACVAALWSHPAPTAAQGPPRAGSVTVLDEACVDRRTEMCLRLADTNSSTVVASGSQEMCGSQVCPNGWYRTVVVPYGQLGPLCVCERRSVGVAEGQHCAEGFKEIPTTGPDGKTHITCELPEMRMEYDRGRWEWLARPLDLVSCLQFARYGPGSSLCRVSVPAGKAN